MPGRVTRKAPELPLTKEERFRLGEARATVAALSEREPPCEALTEVGYEQRQARAEAMRHAVALWASTPEEWNVENVLTTADVIYGYMWNGRTTQYAYVQGRVDDGR